MSRSLSRCGSADDIPVATRFCRGRFWEAVNSPTRPARSSKTSGRAVRFKPVLLDSSKQCLEQTLETASAVAGVWRRFGNALYSTATLERVSMIDLEDPETTRSARHAARERSPHRQRLGGYTPGGRDVVCCDA